MMKVGLIGLGKMGKGLALNLRDKGYNVVAYNRSNDKVNEIIEEGITGVYSIENLMGSLPDRKVIWMFLPAGEVIDGMIEDLFPYLKEGDILIDGANSHYEDTIRRYHYLRVLGIELLDVGTSGGPNGARNGACMMVGGSEAVYRELEPMIKDLCIEDGYNYFGGPGAGHYVKMIHNGIEYGMMQAIGEGFEILSKSQYSFNLKDVAKVYRHGSVIRGWLMDLTEEIFEKPQEFDNIKDIVNASGEGLWTVEEALKLNVPAHVITDSLLVRFRSKQEESFSGKLLAAMRAKFGGHSFEKKD
jgi:6-phosphogluconate dehydrogenase